MGWLLQNILKPLLTKVSAHITSTKQLIQRLDSTPANLLVGKIPISCDVRALYTNIDVPEAINTALEYAKRYDLDCYNISLEDMKVLLQLALNNNIFIYQRQIYHQIRGLAMGGRISGTLAILVMDRFEQYHIYPQLEPASSVYVRYVDDTNTIANNVSQAQEMLTYLNSRHPTIKFDLEVPNTDGFLPILDIMVKINSDGTTSRKHYRKPANRGLTLHFNSHHASTVKYAVAKAEFARAIEYSTSENRPEAIRNARTKLRSNEYPEKWLGKPSKLHTQKCKPKPQYNGVLHLPYISDGFNAQVKSILKHSGLGMVRLVNPRPNTILQLTGKTPEKPTCQLRKRPIKASCTDCTRAYVVYEARCDICSATYVGETTRPLHIRAREHLYDFNCERPTSALALHFQEMHRGSSPRISWTILDSTRNDELRLRIKEAYHIKSRSPSLNRREEDTGAGFIVYCLSFFWLCSFLRLYS